MKKILIFLLSLSTIAQAQQLGFNGNGFFENQSDSTDKWFGDLRPFVIRVPGGAVAKYARPAHDRGGWGMDNGLIDTITFLYKSQEEEPSGDILAKWNRKLSDQPVKSYLDNLIEFVNLYPDTKVIWVANIYIPAELAIEPIDYLIANGVDVVCVEMGNESYSQVKHGFNEYVSKMTAIHSLVVERGIPVSHPAAPLGGRQRTDHTQWNTSLNEYITGTGDWITFHPYFDGRELPCLVQPVDTVCAIEQIEAFDFDAFFADIKDFYDAGGYIVTESNIQPSNLVGDTEVNAIFAERLLIAGKRNFNYFCIHSGRTPDKYGLVYGVKSQKKNTTFEAFDKANATVKVVKPKKCGFFCWIINLFKK
jgi:hypothetical protein